MASIPWLEPADRFPTLDCALASPNGLLAAGADLSSARLVEAYESGIFPWYEDGQPLLWWSPDPRAVLKPTRMNISRSLKKRLRRQEYDLYLDRDFAAVVSACAAPRSYASGTWITDEMFESYCQLHDLGFGHSVEAYRGDELVGGLYGVCVGNLFCGESMFHRSTDASKVAFAHLARFMHDNAAVMVDCQLENDHLMSLGCELIPRKEYIQALEVAKLSPRPDWTPRQLVYDWNRDILIQ
jgi:leucyl/phenylalanyl-tRNA--protein transferase